MINLIPNEEKKRKVKDFYLRFSVVFFLVLSFSILIGGAGLLPAYFLSFTRSSVISNKLELQNNEVLAEVDQETDKLAKDLNAKLAVIEKIKDKGYMVSDKIISQIMTERMSDIKIGRIYYQNTTKGKAVIINGTAPSRERLLLFRQALERNTAFKKVDLPVSNFIQGSNIKFTLNLIPS